MSKSQRTFNKILSTYEDVGEILQLSPKTLRCWKSQGRIEATKIGRSVRFTPEQIQKIIDSGAKGGMA